jgi:predicted DNA-binding antitoxin AbrB/MazE fold protein
MSAIRAIYEDGVFRPAAPVALPDHCEVDLEFHVRQPECERVQGSEARNQNNGGVPGPSIEEKLAALAAQVPAAEWGRLPPDLSDQLDHYVYGVPPQ